METFCGCWSGAALSVDLKSSFVEGLKARWQVAMGEVRSNYTHIFYISYIAASYICLIMLQLQIQDSVGYFWHLIPWKLLLTIIRLFNKIT